MIVSKTTNAEDPDITDKIWDFLKLLPIDVEPPKSIQIFLESCGSILFIFCLRCNTFVNCSKFGITEEQFAEVVWPRIDRGLECT
ncbi:hypothetical protein ABKV19_011866 [Rosa sericea]